MGYLLSSLCIIVFRLDFNTETFFEFTLSLMEKMQCRKRQYWMVYSRYQLTLAKNKSRIILVQDLDISLK